MSTPVEDYLSDLPQPRRARIETVYAIAHEVAPEAAQGVKYAMPCLVVAGSGLIAVMSTARHVGIYPFSGSTVAAHATALAARGIPTTKGAIQLPDDVDLPEDLLRAVVTTRLAEIRA